MGWQRQRGRNTQESYCIEILKEYTRSAGGQFSDFVKILFEEIAVEEMLRNMLMMKKTNLFQKKKKSTIIFGLHGVHLLFNMYYIIDI